MDDEQFVQQATQMTAANLRRLTTEAIGQSNNTSHISVPEREELIQLVSEILPAGNVVGFVFNGIKNVKDRGAFTDDGRTHISSLFKGLAIVRDNAFYRMMFAGPATVLAGYNMILRLAGAQPDHFLPDGAWQFYVEFGLREDTARHSNETLGFHRFTEKLRSSVSEAQALCAWVLATMSLLRDYDKLFALVWEERIRLRVMEETTGLQRLHRAWEMVRPFGVEANNVDFVSYRRRCFNEFCEQKLSLVSREQRRHFQMTWDDIGHSAWREGATRAYQQQMSIRSYLEAGDYSERRVPIKKQDLSVAIVHRGSYFLIGFIDPADPAALSLIQTQVELVLNSEGTAADLDGALVKVPRGFHGELRASLDDRQQRALAHLQTAPVVINWDKSERDHSLDTVRRGRRGVGDNPVTVFATSGSMVLDFSHIYFDGPWSMEVSEILVRLASSYVGYFTKRLSLGRDVSPKVLNLSLGRSARRFEKNLVYVVSGVGAEAGFDMTPLSEVRRLLVDKMKPAVHLTVNDLLVLYRTIFNQCYQVSAEVWNALSVLNERSNSRGRFVAIESMFNTLRDANPSLLIPIDASRFDPKERVFPSTFRSPFADLLKQHREVLDLMNIASSKASRKEDVYQFFSKSRAGYLSVLSTFGDVMRRYSAIALNGQSMSTTAIRLVAGLPGGMQKLVDGLPGKFSFMNEAIKGEEVFSNVGRVSVGSSISRFMSAKDDNDKKVLVWGIMTDDSGIMRITLRDFRPPVLALVDSGYGLLAQQVTQDFLDGYVVGLLGFVGDLKKIIHFSTS